VSDNNIPLPWHDIEKVRNVSYSLENVKKFTVPRKFVQVSSCLRRTCTGSAVAGHHADSTHVFRSAADAAVPRKAVYKYVSHISWAYLLVEGPVVGSRR
jgi:hypothetical protein